MNREKSTFWERELMWKIEAILFGISSLENNQGKVLINGALLSGSYADKLSMLISLE